MSDTGDLEFGETIRRFAGGQKVFGHYGLKHIIGHGRIGLVWLAHDEMMDREVALKFLPEMVRLDAGAIDDLKRETRQSQELTHENIVRTYDFVEEPGCAAVAMEYVDGATLTAWRLQQWNRIFRPPDIMPWAKQVCAALEYAHNGAGIVHRDLNPSNLMLDRLGRLKVAGFGIARSISDSITRLTIQRAGSNDRLAYMSPQQAQGESSSPLDDVYSLGATFYELLTSRPPFYSGEIYQQVLKELPAPISQRRTELGIASQPLPASWEETILACLAKDPAQRPQSIAEVWSRLNREPTPAAAGPFPPGIARKSKFQAARIAAVGLLLLAAGSAGWWYRFTTLKTRPIAGVEGGKHAEPERLRAERETTAEKSRSLAAAQADGAAAEAKIATQRRDMGGATRENPFENGLGMKFVPVPGTGVLFSVWDTRVKDYQAFCEATAREWKKPDFAQTAEDPAVMVNWEDAKAFCAWLTEKDRKDGKIRKDQEYRLPTDAEWSAAVGSGKFPWGNEWPPPKGAGNYDPSLGVDSYVKTSPCGSLSTNEFGLCDMGGNVWQWCGDWYRADMNEEAALETYPELNDDGGGQRYRVIRGGSWNSAGPEGPCSSPRSHVRPEYRLHDGGFRCVLASSPVVLSAGCYSRSFALFPGKSRLFARIPHAAPGKAFTNWILKSGNAETIWILKSGNAFTICHFPGLSGNESTTWTLRSGKLSTTCTL